MGKIIFKAADGALSSVKADDAKVNQAAVHLEYLFSYGVDFLTRTISISREIDEDTFHIIDSGMREMERVSRKGITILVNSYGGSVYDALAIVGRIRASTCQVTTIGYGKIMSASVLILACGDKRQMSEFATLMHHESSYGLEGRHAQNKATIKQFEKEEQTWAEHMAKFTNEDKEFWASEGVNIDKYFTAQECKELGVVDELI